MVESVTALSSDALHPNVLGIDIGGANLKAADCFGRCHAIPFPLWKYPEELSGQIIAIVKQFPAIDCIAITLTGELADCYQDRADGVQRIVNQCVQAIGPRGLYYSVDGAFLAAEDAVAMPDCVAASNWHAIASLAARWCDGDGLLIDIGSTTTDLIPLRSGNVFTRSRTDFDRLGAGELIYSGIGRTPVCSLVDALPYANYLCPIMNEVFAIMDDCVLLTGHIPEQPADFDTCDGRPRTIVDAANRMARMIGLDHRQVSVEAARHMAAYVVEQWKARITVGLQILSSDSAKWILSGHGTGLLALPDDRQCLDLGLTLGQELSRSAPAYAVARLALEKLYSIQDDTFERLR